MCRGTRWWALGRALTPCAPEEHGKAPAQGEADRDPKAQALEVQAAERAEEYAQMSRVLCRQACEFDRTHTERDRRGEARYEPIPEQTAARLQA